MRWSRRSHIRLRRLHHRPQGRSERVSSLRLLVCSLFVDGDGRRKGLRVRRQLHRGRVPVLYIEVSLDRIGLVWFESRLVQWIGTYGATLANDRHFILFVLLSFSRA